MGNICGWILLFRVVRSILCRWMLWFLPSQLQVLLSGFLELSGGCCDLRMITDESIRFIIFSVFLSCGGLCVAMQTLSITKELGCGQYFTGKLIQTGSSLILSFALSKYIYDKERYPALFACLIMFGALCINLMIRKNNSRNLTAASV